MEAFVESPPPPVPLGQLLAAERERQGLSRADVAQRLHMSAWQVEALEGGDYARLPKGPFLRGFVRNYTKLLGLNSDAALDALAHVAPDGPAPAIVVPSQNIRFDPLGERLTSPFVKAWAVAGVALALALAAMYWWLFVRPAPPAVTAAARKEPVLQPAPQNLAAAPVSAPEPFAPREAPRVEEPAIAVAPARPPAAAEPPAKQGTASRPTKPPDIVPGLMPVQSQRTVPGARTITLRFKGPSWVEVRERGGKVVFQKLNEAGSEAEVSGRPPLSVIVGNAPDVSLRYDDRDFPLEPHTRVAVARFTLE